METSCCTDKNQSIVVKSNKSWYKVRYLISSATESPAEKDLLKKIIELEQSQKHLEQELSRLRKSAELRKQLNSLALYPHASPLRKGRRIQGPFDSRAEVSSGKLSRTGKFTDEQYLNIVQSMGQAVHVFDLNMQIILWNAMAEKQFGYSAEEAVGQNPLNVMVDDHDVDFAMSICQRCAAGEAWTGEFPLKNKYGERFYAVTTVSPFYDDHGSFVGLVCFTSDRTRFLQPETHMDKLTAPEGETSFSLARNTFVSKLGLDSKRAVISKISDLAFKMRNKARSKMPLDESTLYEGSGSGDSNTLANHRGDTSTTRVDFIHSPFGVFTYHDAEFPMKPLNNEIDKLSAFRKELTSKAEEWMVKKSLSWPWKGHEKEVSAERPTPSLWQWALNEQEKYKLQQNNPFFGVKSEKQAFESNKPIDDEASSLWFSSLNASSNAMNKIEILWDDLTIGEQIGHGSCGVVYRGLWFGSDVAVKVFSKQEYSEELIQSSRQELVALLKRLRHPNVMLFLGAVTSPQRFCTVSEFLPRGSLFRVLRRSKPKLDWGRRIRMALDIACGMDYLHCSSPPIVHRNLKSSNLLVDRNWTVKVADFGLSPIKHETYLTTKSEKGTPQWMAPEVLRNESADKKSDIYSFGVVLWELATEKIPWETHNPMQVIGAVGFMDQRLEIPKDIDPSWVSIIESCWHSDTKLRPTFNELMDKLNDLLRKYTIQLQANGVALPDNPLLNDN